MPTNSSIKVLLYTSKVLKSGESPIMLRIIKNRKPKYISIGHSCNPKLWDMKVQRPKNSHPNKRRLDIFIDTKITEVEQLLLDIEIKNKEFSIETLTRQIRNSGSNADVFSFIDTIVKEENKADKVGNSGVYHQTKSMLKKFSKKDVLIFSDITTSFLKKYETFFRMKGLEEITISFYMRTLRAVFNRAIAEGCCDKSIYPFHEYKISNLNTKTVKRAITKEDIKKIAKLNYEEYSRLFHSKNYFLFSFYTQGMNFIDIAKLKWSNIKNGRLNYTRSKTNKPYDVGLLLPAFEILEHYKKPVYQDGGEYIFPILSDFHDTAVRVKNRVHKVLGQTDKDLKTIADDAKIEVNLTTYVARHTYATVLKRCGVPTAVISESMGHDTERTTQIYLDSFDNDVIDEANKNLL